VILGGSQNSTVLTDAVGNYSFTGLAAGGNYTVTPSAVSYSFTPTSQTFNNLSGNQTVNFSAGAGISISGQVTASGIAVMGVTIAVTGTQTATAMTDLNGNYNIPVAKGGNYTVTPTLSGYTFTPPNQTFNGLSTSQTANFTGVTSGLAFYPVTPCRVADTRSGGGKTGAFGPPTMGAGTQRSFTISQSSCGIPSTAAAFSLNVTVVPSTKYLGYLSIWPTGQSLPVVSTLNSYDGRVVANAAIVPAGTGGAIRGVRHESGSQAARRPSQ
jgi:hypothetical protein